MPSTLTLLIPSLHDGPGGSWLKAIFGAANGYAIQSKAADTLIVTATSASGMAGYTVTLKGSFSYSSNGDLYWSSVSTAELMTPGGVAASIYRLDSSRSIDGLGNMSAVDIFGSPGADTLNAGSLNTTLDGGPGDDLIRSGNYWPTPILKGGPGADTMIGSRDDDRIISGDGADSIDGGAGLDDVFFDEATGIVEVWLNRAAPAGGIRIDNVELLRGAKFGLIVHGGPLGEEAMGEGLANDTMYGGGGDDNLVGYMGNDLLAGEEGDDNLPGDEGNDTLLGGAGKDKLWGSWGNDSADGGDGDDFIRGEDGNDYLLGGGGFDDMHGNKGEDTLYGQAGHDWVVGGQGSDLLYGDADNDLMYGNMAADTMYGGTGADTMRGGQEGDTISGGDGNDWLFGDRGDDTMSGGDGADWFFVTPESGNDRIVDFNSAAGDRIAFEGPRLSYTLSFESGDAVILWDGGAKMTLVGVSQAALGTWLAG